MMDGIDSAVIFSTMAVCLMILVLLISQIINYHIRNEKLFEEMAVVLFLEFSRFVTIKEVIIIKKKHKYDSDAVIVFCCYGCQGSRLFTTRDSGKKENEQFVKKKNYIITIVFITVIKIVLFEYLFFVVFLQAVLSPSVSFP